MSSITGPCLGLPFVIGFTCHFALCQFVGSPILGQPCWTRAQEPQSASLEPRLAHALDRVIYGPVRSAEPSRNKPLDVWLSSNRATFEGRIRQFDADKLLIELVEGQSREISSDRVESIEIGWDNAEAELAVQLVQEKKYHEAIPALEKAIVSGVPRWQQRFLLARLIQAVDALGSTRTAGVVFLKFAASSPPPILYADMPLCWAGREADAALLAAARQWLSSDEEHARLLGASWLLLGTESELAKQTLVKLQSSANSTIAKLAVAQSWRLVPPPQTRMHVQGWFDERDQLAEPLQLGPTEFIADRLMRVGEVDLAIGQWMRIASGHGERYHRAAAALRSAAELLKREGRHEEAKRLEPWIEDLVKS